jgi:S-adenosylmethionine hydrolase
VNRLRPRPDSALAAALASALAALPAPAARAAGPLVLLSDFGTRDGAVSAMKGVAYGVSPRLVVSDLTHQVTDIWTGANRLAQTAPFWPAGTVFVAVVDPGVGTSRLSVVVQTRKGHLFVGPDNGLFTLVAEQEGLVAVRRIDEAVNRRRGSEGSHTFHGRDVFAYTGARLAAGAIPFSKVGPTVANQALIRIEYRKPVFDNGTITGLIPVLDVEYGNVWSNIPQALFEKLGIAIGERVHLRILKGGTLVAELAAPYQRTFGEVPQGQPLVYVNSLWEMAVALDQASFAARYHVESGLDWTLELRKE